MKHPVGICLISFIASCWLIEPAWPTPPKPPIFDVELAVEPGVRLGGSLKISSSKRVKNTNAVIQLFPNVREYRAEHASQTVKKSLGKIAPGEPARVAFQLNSPPPGVYALNVRATAELMEPWIYQTENSLTPFFLTVGTTIANVLSAEEFRELQNNSLLGKHERPTPPWGTPLGGLKTFVRPLQSSYSKDDPLRFEIGFQNVGDQTLLLSDYMLGELQWRLRIDGRPKKNVRRPNGMLVQNVAFGKYQSLENLLPGGFLKLPPGDSWRKIVTLDPQIAKELRAYEYNDFRAYHLYSVAMLPQFKNDPGLQNVWVGNVLSEDPGPGFILE